ncbi:MAG: response regulator [Taibaiella sp.]|nr:response regulator [Taibaiella sp.]
MKQSARIMIFDDNRETLMLYKSVLSREGYNVHTSENCSRLMEKIDEVHPDIVMMDNQMPGMSGEEAIEKMKADAHYESTPVIYCSGDTDLAALANKVHADAFLPKPISIPALLGMIGKVLKGRRNYNPM